MNFPAVVSVGEPQSPTLRKSTDSKATPSIQQEQSLLIGLQPQSSIIIASPPAWKAVLEQGLDSVWYTVIMIMFTVYALFGYDLKLWALPASTDVGFGMASLVTLCVFSLDLVMTSLVKSSLAASGVPTTHQNWVQKLLRVQGYVFSFMWLMDLIATVSLITEIPALFSLELSAVDTNLVAARASRVSRVGSRAGRVIRMVRLARMVKLYTLLRGRMRRWAATSLGGTPVDDGYVRQSSVGAKLSDLTTRRVIVVVLLMLVAVPLLTPDERDAGPVNAVGLLHSAHVQGDTLGMQYALSQLHLLYGDYGEDTDPPGEPMLVYFDMQPKDGLPASTFVDRPEVYSELRSGVFGVELQIVELTTDNVVTSAWFNRRPGVQTEAMLSISLTLAIVLLLGVGALQFSSDAQQYVLRPLETLLAFVGRVAVNPFQDIAWSDTSGLWETQQMEVIVRKLAALLQIAYGRHGAATVLRRLVFTGRARTVLARKQAQAHISAGSSARATSPGSSVARSNSTVRADASCQAISHRAEHRLSSHPSNWHVLRAPGGGDYLGVCKDLARGVVDPVLPGAVQQFIALNINIADAFAVAQVLGRQYPAYYNAVATQVHSTVISFGGAVESNSQGGWTAYWDVNEFVTLWGKMVEASKSALQDVDDSQLQHVSAQLLGTDSAHATLDSSTGRMINDAALALLQSSKMGAQLTVGSRGSMAAVLAAAAQQVAMDDARNHAAERAEQRTFRRRLSAKFFRRSSRHEDDSGKYRGDSSGVPTSADSSIRTAATSANASLTTGLAGIELVGGASASVRPAVMDTFSKGPLADPPVLPASQPAAMPNPHYGNPELPTFQGCPVRLKSSARQESAHILTELVWTAGMHIHASLSRSSELQDSLACAKLRDACPGWQPRLFGVLHAGWGVRGVVGGEQKLDVRMLGPHVEFMHHLQTAATLHQASLLMTAGTMQLLPQHLLEQTRWVDTVAFAEPAAPRSDGLPAPNAQQRTPACRLYATNAWPFTAEVTRSSQLMKFSESLSVSASPDVFNRRRVTGVFGNTPAGDAATEAAIALQAQRFIPFMGSKPMRPLPIRPFDFVPGVSSCTDELRAWLGPYVWSSVASSFRDGLEQYLAGDWGRARKILLALFQHPELGLPQADTSTRALLDFMLKTKFVAPRTWAGVRVIQYAL